jgi:hypothetical protein
MSNESLVKIYSKKKSFEGMNTGFENKNTGFEGINTDIP